MIAFGHQPYSTGRGPYRILRGTGPGPFPDRLLWGGIAATRRTCHQTLSGFRKGNDGDAGRWESVFAER